MKKKNIIIIAVVAAVALLAIIIAVRGSRTSTFDQDYHIADTSTITKIFMADKMDHSVLLTRVPDAPEDSAWMVNETYMASSPQVELLLSTLNEMRIRQLVNKKAVPNIIKAMAAKNVKVEVYQRVYFINWFGGKFRLFPHEKLTNTYYVGHETQDMMGTYMLRNKDKQPVVAHIPGFRGFLAPRFVATPDTWRSHRIVDLPVQRVRSVEMEIPSSPEESFSIYRNGDSFAMELTQGHRTMPAFDTARVASLLSSLTNLNFDEFAASVPNTNFDTSFAAGPRTILRITDMAGRTREVKTYLKYSNPDDRKAMPEESLYNAFDLNRLYAIIDNTDTVLIQYYVFDNILQPASFFLGQDPVKVFE